MAKEAELDQSELADHQVCLFNSFIKKQFRVVKQSV